MEGDPKKPIPILYDTYLAVIKNGVESKMFRHFYAYVDGNKVDIVKGGELACGFFVSFVLHNFKLIGEPHLTVAGTEKDLQELGWQEIGRDNLKEGCVLIWQSEASDADAHKHIGFYIGNDRAVSTDSKLGVVSEHHFTFNNSRPIEKAYWFEQLK